MDGWQGLLRTIVVGRKDGIRAAIRRELNVGTWLDETESEPPPVEEPEAEPGWQWVAKVDDLPAEGQVAEVFAGDLAIVLVRVDGQIHAVDSVCPHAGGPLGEGDLDGTQLTCPWHGWAFDVTTGVCGVDAATRLDTFVVRVDGEDVFVAASPTST
ncbi:MAG: Rieske (2Fe-2S) protein [Myxococcota bacterium]